MASMTAMFIGTLRAWCARLARLLLIAVLLAGGPAAWSAEPAVPREYQLKAAFLFNFTKFIEWPPQSFAHPQTPIVVSVLGPTPFAAALEAVARDKKINGRSLIVRQVDIPEEIEGTHVLFVAVCDDVGFRLLQRTLDRPGVVTIGESPAFAAAGGTINFILHDNKVRFEINMAAAERSGLRISSQLQKLAAAVRRAP